MLQERLAWLGPKPLRRINDVSGVDAHVCEDDFHLLIGDLVFYGSLALPTLVILLFDFITLEEVIVVNLLAGAWWTRWDDWRTG